ncbi:hypothetical protein BKA70DRAFT_254414 [Coprinopsis sp. MPI-PUGE-AT-0042]|nr:hypothetical protein BKA70DRAFT_254414 [Coprinopsis sp. MPI-PUGE-AT-0042]
MTVVGGIDMSLHARDLVDWIRSSSFRFVSLALHGVLRSVAEVQTLFVTPASSLYSMQRLNVDLPALESGFFAEDPQTMDVSSSLPDLDHLILSVNDDRKLSVFFIHATLTKVEMSIVDLNVTDILKLIGGLPSLQSLLLAFCSIEEDEEDGAPGDEVLVPIIHHSVQRISLDHAVLGQLFNDITCPALENLELMSTVTLYQAQYEENLDDTCARDFGNFIKRSQPASLSLHVDGRFPITFLSILLSASSPSIKTLNLASLDSLPLDNNANGTRLILPRSIQCIQCCEAVSKEEATLWMGKLALCIEDKPNSKLRVRFGEGEAAYTGQFNEV